jgi:nucleoside-diphosphate-sugar epimerase
VKLWESGYNPAVAVGSGRRTADRRGRLAVRVLIIGGTNFIGPHLVRRLADGDHEVAVFHRGQSRAELPNSVRHITGDRHQLAAHRAEFAQFAPDVVADMIAYTEADARGLAETFRDLARRFVVLSSGDVYLAYGRIVGSEPGLNQATPLTEESPLRSVFFPYRSKAKDPDDFLYTYDKIPVERTVMAELGLAASVLRLPMTYGPGDPFRRFSPYLERMVDGRSAIRLDEGLARWRTPRGYVENVAAAVALAIEDDRAASGIYNVAEEPAFSEADWVRRIAAAVGWPGGVETVPVGRVPLPLDVRQDLDMSSRRIREELGFADPVGLDEALRRTIAWERVNPPEQPTALGILDEEPRPGPP